MYMDKYQESIMADILVIVFSFIIQRTTQHFVTTTPVPSCEAANKCNHTGTPICGQDQNDLSNRLFLDECDMFEFNCDNDRAYLQVEIKVCSNKCTQNHQSKEYETNSILTSRFITSLSANTVKTLQNTITAEETPKFKITINEMNPKNVSIEETIPAKGITTPSTSIKEVNIEANITKAPLKPNSTIKNDTMELDTITIKSTHTSSTTLEEVTKEKIILITPATKFTQEISTVDSLTENFSNFNDIITISSSTENTTQVNVTIKAINSDIPDSPTDVTTDTIVSKATTNANSTASNENRACYPKQCFVPSTWETTEQNKDRDLYNILKQRYGNSVKILRQTTHLFNPLKGFMDNIFIPNTHERANINNV